MVEKLTERVVRGKSYVWLSPDEMFAGVSALYRQISESGRKFDSLVPIANGGLTCVKALKNFLRVDDVLPMRAKSYSGISVSDSVRLVYPLSGSVDGKRVLAYDDMVDGGKTLRYVIDFLGSCRAKDVGTATLSFKQKSDPKPNFSVFEIPDDAWLVQPDEHGEFFDDFCKQGFDNCLNFREIRGDLIEIGYDKPEVDFLMSDRFGAVVIE